MNAVLQTGGSPCAHSTRGTDLVVWTDCLISPQSETRRVSSYEGTQKCQVFVPVVVTHGRKHVPPKEQVSPHDALHVSV
jgi:hypothetical protein